MLGSATGFYAELQICRAIRLERARKRTVGVAIILSRRLCRNWRAEIAGSATSGS